MTVTDVKKGHRSLTVIDDERRALQNLIDRRWMWLNKPENKLRRTYSAVLKDTQEMEFKLKELNLEYEESKITNNENR
jgi:hypothetical protein